MHPAVGGNLDPVTGHAGATIVRGSGPRHRRRQHTTHSAHPARSSRRDHDSNHQRPGPGPQTDRRQTGRLTRTATDVGGVALAELTGQVVSPAIQAGLVQQRARMETAGGDRGRGASGPELDRGQVVAHLVQGGTDGGGVALAELTGRVVSPALHARIVQQRARMVTAGGDRGRGASRPELDRGQVVAHLVQGVTEIGGVALAELTGRVVSPAFDLAVGQQRARMVTAGGQRGLAPTHRARHTLVRVGADRPAARRQHAHHQRQGHEHRATTIHASETTTPVSGARTRRDVDRLVSLVK